MKKDKEGNIISTGTLHEILLDIKYRLDHIEDITADERAVIVKLVKQSNQIVEFLKQLELHEVEVEDDKFSYREELKLPSLTSESDNLKKVKEMVEEYMSKQKALMSLEEELEKYKDQITPGQIGEA
jgi:DNA repair exonuclease SbcCD ATPase subunit